MKRYKNIFGTILVLLILISGWALVTWAFSSWSNYNDTKKLENCYSVVGSEINNDQKTENICSKLNHSVDDN